MRRFGDLPRMNCETKVNIFGATTIDVEKGKERLKADIIQKGHPFSWAETKPMNLWQRMCEHFRVTHIVDFTPGSAGLAVAASGAVQYEGSTKSSRNGWIRFWIDASRGCKQTSMRKAILSHGRRCRIRREGSRALFGAAGRRRRRLVRGRRLSSPSLQPLARRLVGGRRLRGSGRACIKNKIRIRCAHD